MIGAVILAVASVVAVVVFASLRRFPLKVSAFHFVAGLMSLAGGGTLVYLQQSALDAAREIQKWPAISARVVDSRIIGKRAIRPNIVYEYRIDNVEYRDSSSLDIPTFGARATKHGEADTLVALYPIGKEITIHYNPDRPTQSKLLVSPTWDLFGKMGLGSFLFGLGLFGLLGFVFKRK